MEDYEGMVPTRLDQSPTPRLRGRRWLLIGGLVLAFTLALSVGVLLGSSNGATQAAALTTGSSSSSQSLAGAQGHASSSQSMAGGQGMQGAQGQCEPLTVTSEHSGTIEATTASGSSVTINTTGSTSYTQSGKTVTASAIKVGTRINVRGRHNRNGSITATSISIGC